MKVLREILIGAGGAILVGLVLAAAEEFFDALSIYLGAVPTDAVMAFDDECPAGWKIYHDGKGRFLLGSGAGYERSQTGGHKEVKLDWNQMPEHSHDGVDNNLLLVQRDVARTSVK